MAHIVPQSPLATNIDPWSPLATHFLQSPLAAHVPWSYSCGTVTSTVISRLPKLACGSFMASSLYLGSVSGMRGPQALPRGQGPPVWPHMCCRISLKASGVASGGLQVEAVPSAFQKPVSGNLAQSSHHNLLGPRKSYRIMHGSFVSGMQMVLWPRLSPPSSWGSCLQVHTGRSQRFRGCTAGHNTDYWYQQSGTQYSRP